MNEGRRGEPAKRFKPPLFLPEQIKNEEMKKRLITSILLLAISTLLGCDKTMQDEIQPQPLPNYYLTFKGEGIDLQWVKNTYIQTAVVSGSPAGYFVEWETDSFSLSMFLIGDSLPNYGSGTIRGNTYLLSCDSMYLNICNGGQYTAIQFEIQKENGEIIH